MRSVLLYIVLRNVRPRSSFGIPVSLMVPLRHCRLCTSCTKSMTVHSARTLLSIHTQRAAPVSHDVLAVGRTLIATEETLLHPSRNPHLTREQIEEELSEMLGLKKVIWLHKGMAGDDAVRGLFARWLHYTLHLLCGLYCPCNPLWQSKVVCR